MLHVYSKFLGQDSFVRTGLDRFEAEIEKALSQGRPETLYPILNQLESMRSDPGLDAASKFKAGKLITKIRSNLIQPARYTPGQ